MDIGNPLEAARRLKNFRESLGLTCQELAHYGPLLAEQLEQAEQGDFNQLNRWMLQFGYTLGRVLALREAGEEQVAAGRRVGAALLPGQASLFASGFDMGLRSKR